MKTINAEDIFNAILKKTEINYIKTTHQLRLILDGLSEECHVSPLILLVSFREWLLKKDIELTTDAGMVAISAVLK